MLKHFFTITWTNLVRNNSFLMVTSSDGLVGIQTAVVNPVKVGVLNNF